MMKTWSALRGHKHREGAAMSHYAGLDVSLEETAICVVDGTGRIVKEMRVPSEPEALVTALREAGLAFERIGLEACSLTAWLHDELRGAGLPAVCIETRQANAAMKTMPNKTDRNDARALAQIMRTGSGADHAHGLVPAGSRQEPPMPAVALASGCTPHRAQRDARDRERGAGRPARGRPQARHARSRGLWGRVRERAGDDPAVAPIV